MNKHAHLPQVLPTSPPNKRSSGDVKPRKLLPRPTSESAIGYFATKKEVLEGMRGKNNIHEADILERERRLDREKYVNSLLDEESKRLVLIEQYNQIVLFGNTPEVDENQS